MAKAKRTVKTGKTKIRPLGEKVLLKRLEAEETTRGGIVLPDTAKEKPQKGKVLAVGDGKLLEDGTRAKFQVKVGDTVLFASYAGTEIKVDGEEMMLLDESEILAIIG
jgi:chaperonin GroES